MDIRKRQYFLRGSVDGSLVSDDVLYTSSLDVKEMFPGWNAFYEERRRVYQRLGFGSPHAYQRYWMYWLYRGGSVITVGPVGIGKTTFALVEVLLSRGKRIIVVPTKALLENVKDRLGDMAGLLGVGDIRIVAYDRKSKEDVINGDFDIALFTSQGFRVAYPHIGWKSDLSVVDDVDAFVKNPKNLDRLMDITSGSIILSSATFQASPAQRKRLMEKFHIGVRRSRSVGFRNIEDLYKEVSSQDEMLDVAVSFIKGMGKGGIVFLPRGEDEERWIALLKDAGIEAEVGTPEGLKKLESGDADVLVGKSAFYGTLVRGIDAPDSIRYTLFLGVPRGEIVLKKDGDIAGWWRTFMKGKVPSSWDEVVKRVEEDAPHRGWSVRVEEDGIRIIYPDITTYIQASGRTSRFRGDSFTSGVSLVLERDRDLLLSFIKRASLYGISFRSLDEVDIGAIRKGVDESRERKSGADVPFRSYLMLVESPHKVETIASLLGGGVFRYVRTESGAVVRLAEVSFGTALIVIGATVGHTSDIVEVAPSWWREKTLYGVSVEEDGFFPILDTIKMREDGTTVVVDTEGSGRDKMDIIRVYREIVPVLDGVILATDPDSEGEKIAYDVGAYLHPFTRDIHRTEFHEITRKALLSALGSMRDIDTGRVEAAITRRVEDRWVGFLLSQKVSSALGKKGLSAGRVQSPVLGWIIDRYDLSRQKKTLWRVYLPFIEGFYIEVEKEPGGSIQISRVEIKKEEKTPPPPYTTDMLLADAVRLLGFSAPYTMKLAQDLFEGGFITYHRTDSSRVSDDGIRVAKMYISQKYGDGMFVPRRWDMVSSLHAQGAHECIRPTKPFDIYEFWDVAGGRFERDHGKLYSLIFRRFMASQSKDAEVEILYLESPDVGDVSVVVGVSDDGYTVFFRDFRVYKLLGDIGAGRVPVSAEKVERPLAYPMREEEVIRLMKERGIGRPSTYGKIIDTIKRRGYVKVSPKGFLIPTRLGRSVWNVLKDRYENFVSEERTALLYRKMDDIEAGNRYYMDVLSEVYEEVISNL